ncbi:MAG: 2-C-methyl-D-erythritol 4-phosphate cytidylyltransferase [Candidatus Endonucleobacter sp. (ex Gigantidas childressi)]|nr:2-C-methyl-D-erythritol 4-phosphate cytidylyltransferase [Candidatus Endonucleobacter sp. (ex Gigantidas childressi)]
MKTDYRHELKYWAIVPAAGIGKRMNTDTPKQYLQINGKMLIEHTLERLIKFPLFEKIIVVLSKDDKYASDINILRHKKIVLAEGGKERYHSVINGLKSLNSLADDNDWVMVHDAARPCVRQTDIAWLVESLRTHDVGGVLGSVVKDTIKRVDSNDTIIETIDRTTLRHTFTPQMFKWKALTEALTLSVTHGVYVTDEAGAMEHAGYKPMMVEGYSDNIKVTSKEDLALAALYIEQQSKLTENL